MRDLAQGLDARDASRLDGSGGQKQEHLDGTSSKFLVNLRRASLETRYLTPQLGNTRLERCTQ